MKDIIGEAQTIDTSHPIEKHKDTPCTNRSPSTHTHTVEENHPEQCPKIQHLNWKPTNTKQQ